MTCAKNLDIDCSIEKKAPLLISGLIANIRSFALEENIYGFPPRTLFQLIEMMSKSSRINTWHKVEPFIMVQTEPFDSPIMEEYAAVFSLYDIEIRGINSPVNFSKERDYSKINELIFEKTHNAISGLLTEPLESDHTLYLITLWFNDKWVKHFNNYEQMQCTGRGRSTFNYLMTWYDTPMIDYFVTETFHSIRIPYQSGCTAILTVPLEKESRMDLMLRRPEFQSELEQHLLCTTLKHLGLHEIQIHVPEFEKRFEMNNPFNLLRKAGLPDGSLGDCIKFKTIICIKNNPFGTEVIAAAKAFCLECCIRFNGISWTGNQPFHFAIMLPNGERILDAIIDMTA